MNRVIVAQAAAGLGAYLLDHHADDGPTPQRRRRLRRPLQLRRLRPRHRRDHAGHGSATPTCSPATCPRPVLAFAIRHLGCSAGVMVTASHNPPEDNGYKVYLADSSQIVPPADADISAAIDAVGRVDAMPRSPPLRHARGDVAAAYVAAAAAIARRPPRGRGGLHADARRGSRHPGPRSWHGPASRPCTPCPSRATPTRPSPPSRSPTPRSPAPWIWR